jgi:hypothetical protein
MVMSLALQAVIVPKNTQMQEIVARGGGKGDQGEEGNRRIGELLGWNWVRVLLSAVAFGAELVELGA